MTTQRYVVVATSRVTSISRVFGPMNQERAIELEAGIRRRYPALLVMKRKAWPDTYKVAAEILEGL